MVFQHFNLINNLTVMDNLLLAPVKLKLLKRDAAKKRAQELLKHIGLLDKADAFPASLSGGQKQRIAIAAILAMRPDVLILDESTAMLDPEGRKEVLSVVSDLNKNDGVTVILITHYMDEALLADKVFVFDKGAVVSSGTPREVFSDAKKINEAKLEPPVATAVGYHLNEAGYYLPLCLTDEELCEAICRSK